VKVPTAVEDNFGEVPKDFQLHQNYPNPFNNQTVFQYIVPIEGYIKIAIYNLLSQQIKSLVDEFQPVGNFQIVWDGTDDHRTSVPSGIYISRFHSVNFSASKKLLYIK
jgi:flagellar hook assembly protein FlgD